MGEGPTYERRIVTVLFADLVGFTTLAEDLDPEDVAAVQDRYFAAIREAVARHGGSLEKFIGDAVLAAFGVPAAHDDDPASGVLTGLAIAAAVERLAAPLGLPEARLAVRVGIATGEVAYLASGTDEGRLTGDVVNTAARLQTSAPPNRVLVDEATALAVAGAVELEPPQELALKGKAAPVRTFVVRGVRPEPSREAAMADLRAPTLGRETELALLADALARVRGGEATETWLVVAAPGTGKTRLLDEFAAAVAKSPAGGGSAAVAGSPAVALHRARFRARDARPFGALADVARSAVAGSDPLVPVLLEAGIAPGRADVVARGLAALARDDGGATALDTGGEPREARFATWLAGLDGLSAGRPSVWLLEDLHWAGPDAVAFLELARATPAPAGRLIVATARPGFLEGRPDWAVDAPDRGRRIVELPTLPAATAAALVDALVGTGTLPPAIVAQIARASDGNCLFVEELLRLWVSAGLLVRRGGAWILARDPAAVAVPTTVQAVYAGQLDELPPDARAVVRRGSVSGRRVPPAWLDQAGVADVPAAVSSLRARRLLDGPMPDPLFGDAYLYRHALLRDAAYASLARADRAALHVAFARWLAGRAPSPDAVAELLGDHLDAALDAVPRLAKEVAPGLDREGAAREAAGWLETAAERALAAGAREHAVGLFGRAVARTPAGSGDGLDLGRRLRRWGEATAETGQTGAAVDRLRAALAHHEQLAAGAAAGAPVTGALRVGLAATGDALARVLGEQLLFRESAATADAVLAEIGDADDVPAARLRLRGALARNMWSDDDAELAPAARSAAAIADQAGDRALALDARMAVITLGTVTPRELAAEAPAVEALARELGRTDVVARALRLEAAAISQEDGDPTARIDEAAALAVAHGLDEQLGWAEYLRAENALRTGDWDTVIEAGRRATDLGIAHEYHRVVVRSWFAVVPVAAARGERELLARAAAWFAAHEAFFPDSPYGRLMRTGVDLAFHGHGLAGEPDLASDRLLASFSSGGLATWYEAADAVLARWLADARVEDAAKALGQMDRTLPAYAPPSWRAAQTLVAARIGLARGDAPGAAQAARDAAALATSGSAPWVRAKALRLLGRTGLATRDETAEAEAIERRLGALAPAP